MFQPHSKFKKVQQANSQYQIQSYENTKQKWNKQTSSNKQDSNETILDKKDLDFIDFNNQSSFVSNKSTSKRQYLKKDSNRLQQSKKYNKKQADSSKDSIQFEDTLFLNKNIKQDSTIVQYGNGLQNIPETLLKPKFGFKICQTDKSSEILKQIYDQYEIILKQSKLKKKTYENNQEILFEKYLKSKQVSINSIKSQNNLKDKKLLVSSNRSSYFSINDNIDFKRAFKKKQQKASSINSSLTKHYHHSKIKQNNSFLSKSKGNMNNSSISDISSIRLVQLNELKRLQQQVGKMRFQNNKMMQNMKEKDEKIVQLKAKKEKYCMFINPYTLQKQNQLLNQMLNEKPTPKTKPSTNLNLSSQKLLYSTKNLQNLNAKKQSPIKSLENIDLKEQKWILKPTKLTKLDRKLILNNRGLLMDNENFTMGFTFQHFHLLTIYITLRIQCINLVTKFVQNGFCLRSSDQQKANHLKKGKQITFTTIIQGINKSCETLKPIQFDIILTKLERNKKVILNQQIQMPVLFYNLLKHVEVKQLTSLNHNSCTKLFKCSKDLIKNPQHQLKRLFPLSFFDKSQSICYLGFQYQGNEIEFAIKIKQKMLYVKGYKSYQSTNILNNILPMITDNSLSQN